MVIYMVRTFRREDEADIERPESCAFRVCANAFGTEVEEQEIQTRSDLGSLASVPVCSYSAVVSIKMLL